MYYNNTVSDVKTLVRELHECIEKSNNIIIFNTKEEPFTDGFSPIISAENILKTLDLNIPITHTVQLGKKSTKLRSFMIKLGNKSEILSVLKEKRKLYTIDSFKHIFMGVDVTTQCKEYNNINHKLQEKKRSSDNRWYIKFVDGTPTLAKNISRNMPSLTTAI